VLADIYSPDPAPGQERPVAVYDANALDIIIKSTTDKQSLIRSDAIRHLGETKDPKYADRYIAALNDPSYDVIDEAAIALARTKDPKASAALVKLTTTPSWRGRIQMAGLRGLAELGDKSGFESGYKIATDKSQPMQIRNVALSLVAATGKGDERAFPLIFDKFKYALATENQQGMINTVEAIIKIADPRGQQVFDMLKAKFKDSPNILDRINIYETRFKAALQK
jgi:HEAT repeat protein